VKLFVYLHITNASDAIAFYQAAFGARELYRLTEPGGTRIGHAELDFGGTTVMLADAFPEFGVKGPDALGGTPVTVQLQVENADAVIARAIEAGAALDRPIQDQFYGERTGTIRDPFGHRWNITHRIEEVTPAEMQRRWNKMAAE
jgi:PhnB protein